MNSLARHIQKHADAERVVAEHRELRGHIQIASRAYSPVLAIALFGCILILMLSSAAIMLSSESAEKDATGQFSFRLSQFIMTVIIAHILFTLLRSCSSITRKVRPALSHAPGPAE